MVCRGDVLNCKAYWEGYRLTRTFSDCMDCWRPLAERKCVHSGEFFETVLDLNGASTTIFVNLLVLKYLGYSSPVACWELIHPYISIPIYLQKHVIKGKHLLFPTTARLMDEIPQ